MAVSLQNATRAARDNHESEPSKVGFALESQILRQKSNLDEGISTNSYLEATVSAGAAEKLEHQRASHRAPVPASISPREREREGPFATFSLERARSRHRATLSRAPSPYLDV